MMRVSEFRRAVRDEFGEAYGAVVTQDVVVAALADRTAEQALQAGIDPREIWLALCEVLAVDPQRRHGVGLLAPPDQR